MTIRWQAAPATIMLTTTQLCKSFPGVQALSNISLNLSTGEVLAVVGENGAGKSTLMKILAGVQTPDTGSIELLGKQVRFDTTRDALNAGIVLIHQELNLCDDLNVGQNIFLGREPTRLGRWGQRLGLIDFNAIYQQSKQFLSEVGLNVSPNTRLGALTIGKQQMVEIAKALSANAKVLIFDEPTSSLSAAEAESLFRLIDKLRSRGIGIIYISHRLAEVERLADRVVVLRDGQHAGELAGDQINYQQMVSRMVGRDVSQIYQRTRHPLGDEILAVENLKTSAWPEKRLSFNLRAGEILGIAGLVGSGRTELLETLFGIQPPLAGTIAIAGRSAVIRSPRAAVDLGIALVPEDRKQHGLLIDSTVGNNLGLARLQRNSRLGFARFSKQKSESKTMIERLEIKTPSDRQRVKFLSGGNQQKIVLGKWLLLNPRLLLLDEPTRGIDVGAKQEIYRLMEGLAAQSMGIVMVSSELEEIMGVADRVLVLCEGELTGELIGDEINEQSIMRLATS